MVIERLSFVLILFCFVCKVTVATNSDHGPQQELLGQGPEEEPMSHYGRNTLGGIPFRPVRRMGSEFLGKRSENPFLDKSFHQISEDKRALGSEFLGKRRLGSEFLGKRGDVYDNNQEDGPWSHDMNAEKRALGSEFLGKRRPQSLWDWSWKRGLGSEFLGKRVLGSEFLGKRSPDGEGSAGGQEVVGPTFELPSESSRV